MTLFARGRHAVALVSGKSFDSSDAGNRARERYRRAGLATAASVLARVLAIVTLFVAVRFVADETSSDGLGLWLLLVTAVALVGFADLGIGNGLLNVVADAHGRDDERLAHEAISTAFFTLCALAAVIGAVFFVIYPHVDWAVLLNVTGPTAAQTGPAVVAFVVCVLVSMPVGVAQTVHLAYQEGWITNLWIGAGSVLSILGVIVATATHAGLAVLVLAMLGGPPVAFLLGSVVLFGFTRPHLRPRPSMVKAATSRRVLHHGFLFFILATAVAVGYQSDTLVISHFIGADAVADYAIPFRLFMLAPTLVALIVTPLWPAYGEAVARGDLDWVHRTFRRSMGISLVLTVPPTLILIPLTQPIIDRWVGPQVHPPLGLIIGIAAWAIVNAVSMALAAFFNGTGVLRFQVVAASAMAISNLALSIVLVQHIGIEGPIIATVVTQIACLLVPSWIIMRGIFRRDAAADEFSRWVTRWGRAASVDQGLVATNE